MHRFAIETKTLYACYNQFTKTYLTPHNYDNVECDYYESEHLSEAALFMEAKGAGFHINETSEVSEDVDTTNYEIVKIECTVKPV